MLFLPSNFSPHQKNLVYVCRGCIGEVHQGVQGRQKLHRETCVTVWYYWEVLQFYPDYLLQKMCPCLNFLVIYLIQPLMG